jgi:hypothetical protein
MRGLKAESTGALALRSENSTLIRGPVSDFSGSTARDIHCSRTNWDLPMSDHETQTVHERMVRAIDVSDINAIAAVRVTLGCNHPTNDVFSPDRPMTRAEKASCVTRAVAQHVR